MIQIYQLILFIYSAEGCALLAQLSMRWLERSFRCLLVVRLLIVDARGQAAVPSTCKKEGDLALTFDQGPSQYTGMLLSALSKNKVKATFHVSPDYLDNPVIVAYLRRIASDGHLVGLFIKESISTGMLPDYLRNCTSVMKGIINYEPNYLRFPVPGPSPAAMKIINGMGFRVTSYNLDSQDYNYVNDPTAGDGKGQIFNVFKNTLDQIFPPSKGSFIAVQRDIVLSSVQQTDAIIKYAQGKGYNIVRLDQCIGADDVKKGSDGGSKDNEKDPRPGGISGPDGDGGKTKKQTGNAGKETSTWTLILLTVMGLVAASL
jgi:peptidoglycan/xylan/chitin deacetylase (PgdA/CDA1 family)